MNYSKSATVVDTFGLSRLTIGEPPRIGKSCGGSCRSTIKSYTTEPLAGARSKQY